MSHWAAALTGLLLLIVLMHAAARLWPKRAGYRYLRHSLSRRGIKTAQIPSDCIWALVEDAHDYAHIVCAPDSQRGGTMGTILHFEFERTLRIYSVIIHAVMTGKVAAETDTADWVRCRAILSRHDLPMPAPAPQDAVAELSQ